MIMAHRALIKLGQNLNQNNIIKDVQRFKYLLVVDFEATCEENVLLKPQEIIEFPCIAISTHDWDIKDTFHKYVKPRVHKKLTPFCIGLTGILQEMVDDQAHFPEVLSKFNEWINKGEYFSEEDKSAFVTCGDWDLKMMMPSQCSIEKLQVPNYFKEWINLKKVFCDITKIYPHGIIEMLIHLNLPKVGRLHSGIDDVKNIVSIIRALGTQHNALFDITSGIDRPNLHVYQRKCPVSDRKGINIDMLNS